MCSHIGGNGNCICMLTYIYTPPALTAPPPYSIPSRGVVSLRAIQPVTRVRERVVGGGIRGGGGDTHIAHQHKTTTHPAVVREFATGGTRPKW